MDNINLFFQIYHLSRQNPLLDQVMIFGAQYLIYLALFLMFVLVPLGKTKERKAFLLALFSLFLALILAKIIRIFYFEPRPFITYQISPLIPHQSDASFPSTHTMVISSIALAFIYYKSRFAPLFLIFLIWLGLGRIFVGVHYPLDILGGFLISLVSLAGGRLAKSALFFTRIFGTKKN